ncbi:hypothetical protein [Burkholderia gladioli]|uniref:hypothetical protein n=1 Tax=Burkholderia gladioli TaxID=28095 RepID=UPI00163EAA5D|nr:hypothetical protein [Burkholderia gladioli]
MQITETTELLKVKVAFQLKDQFKSAFKTSKWDSLNKTWDVKNTTANKNKLAQFQKTLDETQVEVKLAESLAAADEILMTEKELSDLKSQFSSLVSELPNLKEAKEKQSELQVLVNKYTAKISDKKAEVEKENAEIAELKKSNEDKLNEILKIFTFEGMTVQETVEYAGKQFFCYTRYKGNYLDKFYAAQKFLGETYDDIKDKFGIEFRVLDECWKANKNRHDRDSCWFKENVCNPNYVRESK